MSMVLRTVEHLNQAKGEATDNERCAIKTETGTGTANEEGAHASPSGEINIGSASDLNDNGNSGSMAFGSGDADFSDSGSTTVASGNVQQQAGSVGRASPIIQTRGIVPRQSKRIPKGLCNQAIANPDSSAAIISKEMDNSPARGVTRKRNAEHSSIKSRKKITRTSAIRESFEVRYKQLIDFIDEVCALQRSLEISGGSFIGALVRYDEIRLQQGAARTDTKERSHSRSNRASRKDWFQMDNPG